MYEEKNFSFTRIFLLGFGFLGISVIWAMYNAYVPIFLKDTFKLPSTTIGFIMTIDNFLAILLLPYLGALSDKTRTRLGRRRPYILLGTPFATIFFICIPFLNMHQNLGLMMLIIVLMNLSMAIFRSPVIALMPDITPSPKRSQANGIINFMGGLGSLLVYFGGKPLYDSNISYSFLAGGILMFLASLVVVFFINEDTQEGQADETKPLSFSITIKELTDNLKDVFSRERSLLFMLLAIFCWFIGYNSIETFFTSYAKYYLGIKESTGAFVLGLFSVSFMFTAILSGYIGSRIRRKLTIRIGLLVVTVVLVSALFIKSFTLLSVFFIIGGFGWALVNVNSLPMVVDMTTPEKLGGYTGLYYFFSQAANIVAPPISGFCIDTFGYSSLMLFAGILFVCAIVMLQFVNRGEAYENR